MSFTLRQVEPLLTKPELELFRASRASAIRQLTARQLAAKLTRARTLRDKYRDTYRRQTVATRTGPAGQRASKGGENERTQTKGEVMAEVLARFEAQLAQLQAKAARQVTPHKPRTHKAPGAPARQTNPSSAQRSRRSSGNPAPGEGVDLAMRGATTTKPRQIARKERAAQDLGHAVVSARGAASTRAGGTPVRPAAKAPATAKKATNKSAKAPSAKTAITGAAQPAAKLMEQVRDAVERQRAEAPVHGAPTAQRAILAQVGGSASANAQGAVPTNMPAKAQRLNPLKAEPVNKKIHASARSRQKAVTAKRDAR